MKKLLALMLVLTLCLSVLASCAIKDKITGFFGKDDDNGEHTHNFVEGKCECGETDPEYVAPHTHNFVDGKCECGETDPNYEPPVVDPEENLKAAIEYIRQLYKDDNKKTGASYNVVAKVSVGDAAYDVVWTTNVESVTIAKDAAKPNVVTVVVPELGNDEIPYTLTATITDEDDNTESISFERLVPRLEGASAEEYYAAEAGDFIIVDGIISGIIAKSYGGSNNAIYINDVNGEGGYYVYGLSEDPITELELAVGMTVRASGTKDIFNGTHEIKDASVIVLDSDVQEVTPVDYTEIFANAASLTDPTLVAKQGMLVTIKGVTIGDIGDNGYRYFTLGELTSYVRVSSSNYGMSAADLEVFEAAFAANKGSTADATGIITLYSGKFYLVPVSVDAFSNFVTPDRSPEEKVDFELDGLDITDKVAVDTVITLPAAGTQYSDVQFAWTANGEAVSESLNVVLGDEAQTITLKVVATLGDVSKEMTFEIAVDAIIKGAVNLTVDTLGLGAYSSDETSKNVFGTSFSFIQLGSFGNGIQMRDKNGNTSSLWNTTALGTGIKKITLTWSASMSIDHANADAVIFTFGNDVKGATYSTKLSTEAGVKTYTITPDADTYTYFYMEHDLGYTFYWESIVIEYAADEAIVITDEEKVTTELGALDVEKTEFAEDGTLELDVTPVMYDDVTITWTANGEPVANNVLNIVVGSEEQTITLVATVKCGDVEQTKEFTVNVAKKSVIEIVKVTAPVEGVAYKLYINQVTLGKKLYIIGETSSDRYIKTTTSISGGIDVYVEAVADGGFKLYTLVDDEKVYNHIYNNASNKLATAFNATAEEASVYTYNATVNAWVTNFNGTDYYLGTYSDFNTMSASKLSYITSDNTGVSQFPMEIVSFTCMHDYVSDCDTVCDECGETREVNASHTYAADCDADCDVCGFVRDDAADHVANEDDGDCTTAVTCQNCPAILTAASAGHVAGEDDGNCTTAVKCQNCDKDAIAAAADHVANEDDGDCTTAVTCQNCAHVFTEASAGHVPGEDDGDCTTAVKCQNCEADAIAANNFHSYTNCGDTDCNNEGCNVTRETADHLFQHECSETCHECGAANENAVDHFDSEDEDKNCDYCGIEMDEAGDTPPAPVE